MINNEIWDASLTRKLRYLKTLEPIFRNTRTIVGDSDLRTQIKHYDPLAITLKILEIIIDKMSEFDGVTRSELMEEIIPLLKKMDKKEGKENITEKDHKHFLNYLLNTLIQERGKRGRKGYYINYTDYSKDPPEEMKYPFRLISPRSIDGSRVFLEAEAEAINIFLQLLIINLEDTQKANLVILERQLKRGDIDKALESIKLDYQLTKQFHRKLSKLIIGIKRNIHEIDFKSEFDLNLSNAEDHISEIIKLHTVQSKEINLRIDSLDYESGHVQNLNELQEILDKSSEELLSLQTKIRNARKTYLREQILQSFIRRESKRPDLEETVFKGILKLNSENFRPLFLELLPYFTIDHKQKIFTFDHSIDLIFKRIKTQIKPKIIKKPEISIVSDMIDLTVFGDELINNAISFINEMLEQNQNTTDLNSLILRAIKDGNSKEFCDYIRLLIQIQSSNSIYQYMGDFDFSVEVMTSNLTNPLYMGNNYLVHKNKRSSDQWRKVFH